MKLLVDEEGGQQVLQMDHGSSGNMEADTRLHCQKSYRTIREKAQFFKKKQKKNKSH